MSYLSLLLERGDLFLLFALLSSGGKEGDQVRRSCFFPFFGGAPAPFLPKISPRPKSPPSPFCVCALPAFPPKNSFVFSLALSPIRDVVVTPCDPCPTASEVTRRRRRPALSFVESTSGACRAKQHKSLGRSLEKGKKKRGRRRFFFQWPICGTKEE